MQARFDLDNDDKDKHKDKVTSPHHPHSLSSQVGGNQAVPQAVVAGPVFELSESELVCLALLPQRWQARLLELAQASSSSSPASEEQHQPQSHLQKSGVVADEIQIGREGGLERLAELVLDAVGLRLVTEEGETRRALAKLVFNKLGLEFLTKEDAKEIAGRLTEFHAQFASKSKSKSKSTFAPVQHSEANGRGVAAEVGVHPATAWQNMGIAAATRTRTPTRKGIATINGAGNNFGVTEAGVGSADEAREHEQSDPAKLPNLGSLENASISMSTRETLIGTEPADIPIPAEYFNLVNTLEAHSDFIYAKTGRRTISPKGRWLGISASEFEQFVGLLTDGQRPEEVAAALGVTKLTDLARERYHLRNDVPVNLLLSAALHIVAHYVQPQFSKPDKSRSGSGVNANDGWW